MRASDMRAHGAMTAGATREATDASVGRALQLLMLASGAAALIYEVAWTRQFASFIGSSSISMTIVLSALMAGLGIGSWLFGRVVDDWSNRRLAVWLAGCEAAVAVYALLLPSLIDAAGSAYFAYVDQDHPSLALRIVLVAMLVMPPCAVMGGSLPMASRLMPRGQAWAQRISRLYALNTLGAAVGTVASGYLLLAWLGTTGTVIFGSMISLTVAAVLLRWVAPRVEARHRPEPATSVSRDRSSDTMPRSTLLFLYALSGAVAMALEVGWVRALEMTLGTTTYAFTTMLATFLLGIVIGSVIYARLPVKTNRIRWVVGLQLTVYVGGILSVWLMDRLPLAFFWLLSNVSADWGVMQMARFALALLTMIVPTVAMGVLFPLVSDLASAKVRSARSVGSVYAFNAIGGAVGASLAGLVLIPWLGIQLTVVAVALSSALIGLAIVLMQRGAGAQQRLNEMSVALVVVMTALLGVSPWEYKVLSGGMYLYFDNYSRAAGLNPDTSAMREAEKLMKSFDLVMWEPGPMVTVSVMKSPLGVKSLMINGKVDASASDTEMGGDMKTQSAISLLPALMARDHGSAYVVGLGSGVTAGALLDFPFRSLRVAEIAPAVIRASREFASFNNDVVDSPRARIVAEDARHDLRADDTQYDLIVTQPSNLWIAGESGLYTREWYGLLASRLAPGGMVAQWLPAYNISPENFAVVLHTLRASFGSVTLWRTGGRGDLLAIASNEPGWQQAAMTRAADRLQRDSSLALRLESIGLSTDPIEWLIKDEAAVNAWLAPYGEDLAMNTDDRPITEFATPRDMHERRRVNDFIDPREMH